MSNRLLAVRTQFAVFDEEPFQFQSGDVLPSITLAYETYGTLNEEKSNAILLFHALSGSQHAMGFNDSVPEVGSRWTSEMHDGWWEAYIGPGKALDTNRYFIVCANYLGGCYGSTGPSSFNPATGKPYGPDFPHLSVLDVVNSQIRLLDRLGIPKLLAVCGPSVGGLCALSLATSYPDRVKNVISIASGLRTTVLSRISCFEQVLAIENDPHFQGGDYYGKELPEYGLALARMISHKTFVHLDTIEQRARKDIQATDRALKWYRLQNNVESYMLHQGRKFVSRFDANSYLRIMEMWLGFDPLRDTGARTNREMLAACRPHGQRWLVYSIDSDYCFYPEEQVDLSRALKSAGVACMHITVHSDKGHDSFLLEPELFTPHLVYALNSRL